MIKKKIFYSSLLVVYIISIPLLLFSYAQNTYKYKAKLVDYGDPPIYLEITYKEKLLGGFIKQEDNTKPKQLVGLWKQGISTKDTPPSLIDFDYLEFLKDGIVKYWSEKHTLIKDNRLEDSFPSYRIEKSEIISGSFTKSLLDGYILKMEKMLKM